MSLQMNQFQMVPLKGALAMLLNPSTISCQVDPASVDTLYPGSYVKLVATADGSMVIVDKAAATDVSFGVVIYVPKKEAFTAGDAVEIAFNGSIVWMEASAAIDRGAQLEFVDTGNKVVTNTGNPVIGVALDEAAGNTSLLRVLVMTPYSLSATITSGSINNVAIGGSTPAAGTFTTLKSEVAGSNVANVVITPGATPAVDATLGTQFTLTPAENEALTTSGAILGQDVYILVTTSGTSSYTLTFGSGFTSTGTLATGTTSAKKFLIHFKCFVAGALVEVARTTAM